MLLNDSMLLYLKCLLAMPSLVNVLVCIFTVTMYAIFSTRQFSFNGHLIFTLQLHITSIFFSALFWMIFLLWFIPYIHIYMEICI